MKTKYEEAKQERKGPNINLSSIDAAPCRWDETNLVENRICRWSEYMLASCKTVSLSRKGMHDNGIDVRRLQIIFVSFIVQTSVLCSPDFYGSSVICLCSDPR